MVARLSAYLWIVFSILTCTWLCLSSRRLRYEYLLHGGARDYVMNVVLTVLSFILLGLLCSFEQGGGARSRCTSRRLSSWSWWLALVFFGKFFGLSRGFTCNVAPFLGFGHQWNDDPIRFRSTSTTCSSSFRVLAETWFNHVDTVVSVLRIRDG